MTQLFLPPSFAHIYQISSHISASSNRECDLFFTLLCEKTGGQSTEVSHHLEKASNRALVTPPSTSNRA